MTAFRLIRVEYNLDYRDFLSLVLEIFPIDLKRYMDACLPVERLSIRLVQVSEEKRMFLGPSVFYSPVDRVISIRFSLLLITFIGEPL